MADYPTFGGGLLAGEQARIQARQLDIQNMKLDLEREGLGIRKAESSLRQEAFKRQLVMSNVDKMLEAQKAFAVAITARSKNGAPVTMDDPLHEQLVKTTSTLSSYLKLANMDPELARAGYQLAMSGTYEPQETQVLAPGSVLARKGTGEPIASVSAVPTEKMVEVPGELGTTRMTESTGGGVPTITRYQGGRPVGGASQGAQARPSQQMTQQGAGQGGKPLPREAQENITGGLAALKSLDDLEASIPQTGIVRGRVSQVQTALGANPEAIDFETARANLMVQAQAIIKGIPSNFDIKTFEKTLPDMTSPQPVNKSRVEFSRNIVRQLIEDTISYYKFTGARIPPDVLSQARKAGVKVDAVEPWDGRGTPTAKSENLAATGGKKPGIEGMALPELLKLDPAVLGPDEQKMLDKRLKELGY